MAGAQVGRRHRAVRLARSADVDQPLRQLPGDLARIKEWAARAAETSDERARVIPQEAITARQIEASDPGASVFVSASAGAGKTHVLVQRVDYRLLLAELPAGKDPVHHLLTKAAHARWRSGYSPRSAIGSRLATTRSMPRSRSTGIR
ncbi:MAG: UvrD-helicase domain-containing protein [Rhodopseudomonas palustris]|nr:UvrD-helicase domain-containing protein [Rhodopseudomonas palustris]